MPVKIVKRGKKDYGILPEGFRHLPRHYTYAARPPDFRVTA